MAKWDKSFTMSIDQIQSNAISWARILRPSHRTLPEQIVGLGIYLLISLGFEVSCRLTTDFLGTLYFICLGLSMWSLWRRYSLRVLKFELSIFLSQFFFQGVWSLSYFLLHQELLSLVTLLLLWCNTLLAVLLFRKKDPLSCWLLFFPLVWTFYLSAQNMILGITTP